MHFARTLAMALLLGAAGLPASAAPVPVQPAPFAGSAAEAVDWHPSTRHWDHHFHAHQESLRYHQPTEAEHRIRRMRRTESHLYDPAGSAPRYRLGYR